MSVSAKIDTRTKVHPVTETKKTSIWRSFLLPMVERTRLELVMFLSRKPAPKAGSIAAMVNAPLPKASSFYVIHTLLSIPLMLTSVGVWGYLELPEGEMKQMMESFARTCPFYLAK